MSSNGGLVEVDNDENLVTLSALNSLAGIPMAAQVSKPRVVTKRTVSGVLRSVPDDSFLESLNNVGSTAATRVKTCDAHENG